MLKIIIYKMKIIQFIFLVIPIILSGCAASSPIFHNHNPIQLYEGEKKQNNKISLIAGQAYKHSVAKWDQIFIRRVDGKPVYTNVSLRPAYLVEVEPGVRTIRIETAIGNGAVGSISSGDYKVKVEPGKAYQIYYQIFTNNEGSKILYYMCEVGSVEDYYNYFKENDVRRGKPVPHGESDKRIVLIKAEK